VEKAISGDSRNVGEFSVGLEVFERDAATYNTNDDPVVRVQVGRLRRKLKTYYSTEGVSANIRISIPLGCYLPSIRRTDAGGGQPRKASSVAISGIRCLSRLADGEPFVQGLREELLHLLFKECGCTVGEYIAGEGALSALVRRCPPSSPQQAEGRLIEGSVRIEAARLRATIRLLDASQGLVVWSGQFDRMPSLSLDQRKELAYSICGRLTAFLRGC